MYVTLNVGCWMLTRTSIYVYPVRHPFTHFYVQIYERRIQYCVDYLYNSWDNSNETFYSISKEDSFAGISRIKFMLDKLHTELFDNIIKTHEKHTVNDS